MTKPARMIFRQEMELAKACYATRQWAEAVNHLERAHIVGQRYFCSHLISHLWMLRVAWVRQDVREAVGQITRILAVPLGSVSGWVPVGNTGGANVSPIRSMPIPQDLQTSFNSYSLRRQILLRLVGFAGCGFVAWLLW